MSIVNSTSTGGMSASNIGLKTQVESVLTWIEQAHGTRADTLSSETKGVSFGQKGGAGKTQ